jgi:hypothetical protein
MLEAPTADYDYRVHSVANSPMFQTTAVIPGLPEGLRVVPSDPILWRQWSMSVRAYRELRRRECAKDIRQQNIEYERCRRDPAYFLCIWGVIFEARSVEGSPPAWKPFILFHYQVQMIRWLEILMVTEENGRGDGIWEKSRDMGATFIVVGFSVHHFIFEDVFVCGFISRNYDSVYKKNSSDTIFYKIQAMLGLEDAVPPDLRLPRFIKPRGFDPNIHVAPGAIKNPEPGKTCFLVGETTTKLSGVSGRSTLRVNDEAARFDAFHDAWANQQATTDHRLALSSADLKSRAFYNMARLGESCLLDPTKPGPSFMRLNWWIHPFHTPQWYQNQKNRAMSDGDPHKFEREYNIDYFAGEGENVYPRYRNVTTTDCPYDPTGGQMYCFIDNGISDHAAIIYLQESRDRPGTINVVDSFEGYGGEDVTFYASVMTGVYVSGERQYNYDMDPGIHEFMEFTANIRQSVIYIGDPAGNTRGAGGEDDATWYRKLAQVSQRISKKTINVQSVSGKEPRTNAFRKEAVNDMIPMFQFDHRGGARTLYCLQNSKYPKPTKTQTHAPLAPIHDDMSHIRTAFEWGCAYMYAQKAIQDRGPVKAAIRSMSGRAVVHR